MNLFSIDRQKLKNVASMLLRDLKVNVSSISIANCIEEHYEYPSILSLSDCLDKWNIINEVYKIDKAEYNRAELLFPFIAHLYDDGGKYILVNNIKGDLVCYRDGGRELLMKEDVFLRRWDGIALYAEKTEKSIEKDYLLQYLNAILNKMLYPTALIIFLVILCLTILSNQVPTSSILIVIVKCFGSMISLLLIIQTTVPENTLSVDICTFTDKYSCNKILTSKASKLTPWLSWSEIGFFYFSGSLILLLIYPKSINFLAWLNLVSLPYTIWSIIYQYKARTWCILCCSIQMALWFEFLICINSKTLELIFEPILFYLVPICFLIPILLRSILSQFYKQVTLPLSRQLGKFKYNNQVFNQILVSQPYYDVSDELAPVKFGNPFGSTVITMVSNPYCDPCARAHACIENLLKTRNDIAIKVLFSVRNSQDDFRTKIVRHLVALTFEKDSNLAGRALAHWYSRKKNYEEWLLQYPVSIESNACEAIKKQREWCDLANISYSPTILVNGYVLPLAYKLEDLEYILD
ncbi:vitamin K epoxide reductase family protein [Pedobacter sp. AW1-32]|uniref:vitamin K epoxide reductase family protein n=1 Tax=Pedobacter sp. AW1-32 TaxID=3383026 RepID=UPI003FEDD973